MRVPREEQGGQQVQHYPSIQHRCKESAPGQMSQPAELKTRSAKKKGGKLCSYFPARNSWKGANTHWVLSREEAVPLERREGQRSSAFLLVEQNSNVLFFSLATAIFLLCSPERENFLFLYTLTRNWGRERGVEGMVGLCLCFSFFNLKIPVVYLA